MKKIMHADCDCFYAAVEMRDNPALREIPIAVGGRPEQRGVIATCNYPARAFGIHSAMSSAQALRLCPHLHLLPPDFERYRSVSADIMKVFRKLTECIEPLSLDEAYLDISDVSHFQGSGTWMAQWLKKEVLNNTGIVISVGVAPNKFLAKIASDWKKPDGLYVITPEHVDSFIDILPVTKLPGVGPATAERLARMDIKLCSDLKKHSLTSLIEQFGKFGHRLYELCRGIDSREVRVSRERKSISVESTFEHDLSAEHARLHALPPLVEKLKERIARHGSPAIGRIFVKIRFDNFANTTLESGGHSPSLTSFTTLFNKAWQRHSRPVRLIGVGVRLQDSHLEHQLSLFDHNDRNL